MKIVILFLVFTTALLQEASFPSFYHSTKQLTQEFQKLQSTCDKFKLENTQNPNVNLASFNSGKSAAYKAFFVFGEHAREFISPETGLKFAQKLCSGDQQAEKISQNFEMKMIFNLNALSREKAESGNFCLRENENGIDLNRNYASHWSDERDPRYTRTNPGPFAFSEPETLLVKEQLEKFKPTAYFSIHSGTLGLFTPYAYQKDEGQFNKENYKEVISHLYNNYCPMCKVGSCGAEVGYISPGTSMDFAYDQDQVKYAYTFEIYHSKIDLRDKDKQKSFLQVQNTDKKTQINEQKQMEQLLQSHSCFAQTQELTNDAECLKYFNPLSQDQYDYYVETWSNAFMDGLSMIAEKENKAIMDQAEQVVNQDN